MAKNYIYQLLGGKMLVFQDGWIGVEDTGYPLPDCSLKLGQFLFTKQDDIMFAILGYAIEDTSAFRAAVMNFEPMPYQDFKYKLISEGIGGGCSEKIRRIMMAMREYGLSKSQAVFKYTLPLSCVNESCLLPSDKDLVNEYKAILNSGIDARQHTPDWRFKNNIILLTGFRDVTSQHIEFIKDLVAICMLPGEARKYRYISAIRLTNRNCAILLTDSYIGNCDIAFLYQSVTGCDLSAGTIVVSVDTDLGYFDVKFRYADGERGREMPSVSGEVKRYTIE